MLRICFTVGDLLRCRFLPDPAPMVELVVALMMLRRRDNDIFDQWRYTTRRAFPRDARPLLDLVFADSSPEYLDSLSPEFDEAVDAVITAPPTALRPSIADNDATQHPVTPWGRLLAGGDREARQILRRARLAAHDTMLGEAWQQVVTGARHDLDQRNRVLLTEGIGPALATVVPGARWVGDVLHADYPYDRDIHLRGRGITLLPSTVWSGHPLISRSLPDRPFLLVYPARIPLPLVAANSPGTGLPPSLSALIGRTRAAILDTIIAKPPCTTTELARRLGISPGRASEHATVLRQAGLITTHRHRNTVLHTATPLGIALRSRATM